MSLLNKIRHFKVLSIKTRDAPAPRMPGPVLPTQAIPSPPPMRRRLRVAETLEGSEVINRIAREQDGQLRTYELDPVAAGVKSIRHLATNVGDPSIPARLKAFDPAWVHSLSDEQMAAVIDELES